MSRRQRFYLGAALSLLLGLLAIYLLGRLQPYPHTVKHGPAPEVDANPYLAAEQFLRRHGLRVQRADDLQLLRNLPSSGQTLLLFSGREGMPQRQVEQLQRWVRAGGHLVVIADRLWDEKKHSSGDPLLDPLGIQQFLSSDLEDDEEGETDAPDAAADASAEDSPVSEPAQGEATATSAESESESESEQAKEDEAAAEDLYPELTKLYLENEKAPAYASFDTDFHLFDSQNRAHAWANSGAATHMLQLFDGEGLITVLTDSWLWENDRIDAYDNAWLLWYLTQDSAVSLVYRANRDSLASLLLRHFPQALAALALLILLSLWHFAARQGPLLEPASRARRQLEEHLRGSADFLLRRNGQASLLQALQRDILLRARQRHSGFERLPLAEQWQVLGRLGRLPPGSISQCMRPLASQRLSAADFTRLVGLLQTLRNNLDQLQLGIPRESSPGRRQRTPQT